MLKLKIYPPASDNVAEGIAAVLAGSYDPGPTFKFPSPPVILDIGAHVGSFSVWAMHRWPGCTIDAYEPHPESAGYCMVNTFPGANHRPIVHCAAVVGNAHSPTAVLYNGKTNTGQRSLFRREEQHEIGILVATIPARSLPPADILKIDAEGCELEILESYPFLDRVRLLMLEWHSISDRASMLSDLPKKGFRLVRDDSQGRMVADRNLIFSREP